jgi:hypothetical protein
VKRLTSVGLLVALAVGFSAWIGSQRANGGATHSSTTISRSSALILDRRVRCTATVSSDVQAGQDVSVKFTLHNISRRRIKVFGLLWLVVKGTDGTTYDTRVPFRDFSGPRQPGSFGATIRRGAIKSIRQVEVAVRWKGPLRISPGCVRKTLPPLQVAVLSPGPLPDGSTAVSEVVAAAGHMLDECRPQLPGIPVDGQIDAPAGRNIPPMSAQCSVSLTSEGSFWDAQVLVLVPPGLQGVSVLQPYELFDPQSPFLSSPPPPPYEAAAWEDVVTSNGAVAVAGTLADASTTSTTNQMSPSYDWNGTAWVLTDTTLCGSHSGAWGPDPTVEFISVCSS